MIILDKLIELSYDSEIQQKILKKILLYLSRKGKTDTEKLMQELLNMDNTENQDYEKFKDRRFSGGVMM